jgi:hypothetical protein
LGGVAAVCSKNSWVVGHVLFDGPLRGSGWTGMLFVKMKEKEEEERAARRGAGDVML